MNLTVWQCQETLAAISKNENRKKQARTRKGHANAYQIHSKLVWCWFRAATTIGMRSWNWLKGRSGKCTGTKKADTTYRTCTAWMKLCRWRKRDQTTRMLLAAPPTWTSCSRVNCASTCIHECTLSATSRPPWCTLVIPRIYPALRTTSSPS